MQKVQRVVLITFSIKSKKFNSAYERNSFYRELYGWKQIINKKNAHYEYHKKGLLDDIPHLKIDQSLFMIAQKNLNEMERFFGGWHNKVLFNAFEVDLSRNLNRDLNRMLAKKLFELV